MKRSSSDLAQATQGKSDKEKLKSALFFFSQDTRLLFSKSPSDRWSLWRFALLGLDYEARSNERRQRFIQMGRNLEKSLKVEEDEDDLSKSVVDDPLVAKDGKWSKVFHHREVLDQITKDVDRLFVDEESSHAPLATKVLQLWAHFHDSTSYRQGMHELLRPLIRVSHLAATEEGNSIDESDVYFCFEKLMRELESLYEHNQSQSMLGIKQAMTPLQKVCQDIHNRLLPRAAPDVKRKLDELKVEPQLYALRWLRCLFTREFDDKTCLGFWDVLLGQAYLEPSANSLVEMAEFLAVAMILRVRTTIMDSTSQHEALMVLLRFPPFASDGEAAQLAIQASRLRVLGDGAEPPYTLDEQALKQHRLGSRLQSILSKMEAELNDSERTGRLLELVAQAKQIQDVLLDRLNEDDCFWAE